MTRLITPSTKHFIFPILSVSLPPSNAVGLETFSLLIPDKRKWQNILDRIKEVNIPINNQIDDGNRTGKFVRDPYGNGIEIRISNCLLQ